MNESERLAWCEIMTTLNETQATLLESTFYVTSGITGFLFNFLVLFIALKHIDTCDKPRQIIVINMTAADFIMCLIYMITRPYLPQFPKFLCYPYYVAICAAQVCSCINLLWLNLDKFIFVQFPLHYYAIINRFRLLALSVLTWTVIVGLCMLAYHFMTFKCDNAPRCDWVDLPFVVYVLICVMYITIIISCFAISFVIFIIAQHSIKVEGRTHSKMFQRLFFLFSSTLWTFFTCLPYRILYLVNLLQSGLIVGFNMPVAQEKATNFFFRVLVLGMVINPLITIITQRIYRHRLLRYLQQLWSSVKTSEDFGNNNCTVSSYDGRSHVQSPRNSTQPECLRLTDNTAEL